MTKRSYLDVPCVPILPPVRRRPPGAPIRSEGLTPAAEGLLRLQHQARRMRAEAISLSPPFLEDVERRIVAERAVEEALASGRAKTRAEIQWATDLSRPRFDRHQVRWPRPKVWWHGFAEAVGLGALAVFAPFLAYFAIVGLFLS
ncbi:MAG: hypothetical protein AAFS07_17135 [Pseudomonadota bacterium]